MTNKIKLIWQSFESLTKNQLYDILNLRQKVFIIEQDCFYEDIDYFDQKGIKKRKNRIPLKYIFNSKFTNAQTSI